MNNDYEVAIEVLGYSGKLLDASKCDYNRKHPDHIVVFNANVCTEDGKVWFGDIDVTLDADKLQTLAEALGKRVYVLREMDGRFGNEESPLIHESVYYTS